MQRKAEAVGLYNSCSRRNSSLFKHFCVQLIFAAFVSFSTEIMFHGN